VKNLALPVLGGAIVRFSSGTRPDLLNDGGVETGGWQSREAALPQDIVLGFAGDQVALVDRIVLNPKAGDPKTWVRTFAVSVSTDTPVDGFEEVGQFTLAQSPEDQAFKVGRRARFIRIRLLSNAGGRATSLGEIKVMEGESPDYQSVLARSSVSLPGTGPAPSPPPIDEAGVSSESEPNNDRSQANALPLGRRMKGSIDPLGELDHYRLALPGPAPVVVTFEVLGRPYIRTSLSLLDGGGKVLKQFDPGRVAGREATFSWLLPPGEHLARVTEPPASIVLIWDTSGSMGQHNANQLRLAVESYIDQVQPSERLNLIRFSSNVEVLLPGFTNDQARLKAATAGKFTSDGATKLYDAIARALALLDGVGGNKAIVVMTDGQDLGSRLPYPEFWNLLEEKRVRLYTIGLGEQLQKFLPTIATSPARMMGYIAMATNGRFFFARTGEELTGLYQQIAAELRQISTYYLRPSISPGTGTLAVTATGERLEPIAAPSQIELILDVSGSMKRKIEGREMMATAKDVMSQIIKELPDNARVAMRFYGHRIREGRPGDCQDSELVFPFGKIDKPRMLARVQALKALGTTPIAYTLSQVARDFGSAPGEKLVILVTDGKEECGGSPSTVVQELVSKGIKIRLNIVGFALAEAAVRQEMDRVAKITGGKFYDAQNAKALRQAIQQSLAVPYEVRDAAGTKVAGGLTGEAAIGVPQGIYTVSVSAAGKPILIPNVRVRHNGSTTVALRKEGQQIGIKVTGP